MNVKYLNKLANATLQDTSEVQTLSQVDRLINVTTLDLTKVWDSKTNRFASVTTNISAMGLFPDT